MFSASEREQLLQELVEFSRKIDEVDGFLLVGSGANGFRDKYSDLDVLIVVNESDNVLKVHNNLLDFVKDNFKTIKLKSYQHEEDIFVSCFLFDNYLELDLGVWSQQKLRATKPSWKMIFDKGSNIDSKLEETLTLHKKPNIDDTLDDSLSFIWQFVRSATISIKRNNLIKALKDIDFIRNQIVEILCLENSIYYDFDKNIDQLNSTKKERLLKTYDIVTTADNVSIKLREVMELYFDVIEMIKTKSDVDDYRTMIGQYFERN